MTARLVAAVSAVTTTRFSQRTGEDQPLPRGAFQRVEAASTVAGRLEVSALPVPLGPRKRFQVDSAEERVGRRSPRRRRARVFMGNGKR